MNRYPAPELKDLPEDIKAKVLEVQEKAGFVPNVFLALARRPAEWRAFFAKPRPGSKSSSLGGRPASRARCAAALHSRDTSATTSPYAASS